MAARAGPGRSRNNAVELALLGPLQERGDLGLGVDKHGTCRVARVATAISPPGRPATSTQLPLGLLCRLLSQVRWPSAVAGIPL